MRVLICIPCLLTGGTEIQTLSLAKALLACGHEVAVACYFECADSMVKQYEAAGAKVFLLSPDGTRPVGVKATVKSLWSGLRNTLKEFKPDAAHVQYMAPGAIPVILLRALGVRKILATAHTSGDIYSANGLKVIRFLTNHVLSGFQCITLRAERSFFGEECGYFNAKNKAKHFTIYNNLPSYISIRKDGRKFGEVVTVGVISRLEEIKGMDLVVPAFAKVAKENQNCRLLVVGDGSLRDMMESQAKDCGLSDRVKFAGRQEQKDLEKYYDQIDILLMPSRSEGFGLTAVEGMARGCVPVVANTGGLPEVVRDGVDGLLHKPEDIGSISEALMSLLENRDMLTTLSKSATKRAEDFSSNKFEETIRSLYGKLC